MERLVNHIEVCWWQSWCDSQATTYGMIWWGLPNSLLECILMFARDEGGWLRVEFLIFTSPFASICLILHHQLWFKPIESLKHVFCSAFTQIKCHSCFLQSRVITCYCHNYDGRYTHLAQLSWCLHFRVNMPRGSKDFVSDWVIIPNILDTSRGSCSHSW